MNALNQMNLTRGLSLSKLIIDQTKNISGSSRKNLAVSKNLHMKSSISKKLLKSFKVSKNTKKLKEKIDSKRKSMQFIDIPRKFSNERIVNNSIPEYFKTQVTLQREKSLSKK